MPRYPYIVQEALYPAAGAEPIVIESPGWFAWVKEHATFAYQDAPVHFTARREQRPGGWYWYAYNRKQGQLRKRYLGRDEDLTLQRLYDTAKRHVKHILAKLAATNRTQAVARARELRLL
jgi:LuxR family maltose regulon positive regulatory protein